MEKKQIKIIGYKICPEWLKLVYRKSVNFICQECGKHENIVGVLVPHKLIRDCRDGLYTIVPFNHQENNVKIVCVDCHKLYHANEFRKVKCN